MANSGLIEHRAYCHTCAKTCEERNAFAWAHRHVNHNPGHEVEVSLGYFIYSPGARVPLKSEEQGKK